MARLERLVARLRSIDPVAVDVGFAVALAVVGIATAFVDEVHDANGQLQPGYREASALLVITAVVASAPVAVRRRWPLGALAVSALGVLVNLLIGWPAGTLPLATLVLTYTVGSWCPLHRALAGLGLVAVTLGVLGLTESPGLDATDAIGVFAQYVAVWAIGIAMHNRRAAADALVQQADERAEAEHQSAARAVAEERLLIAQELHDIVAHSMSVIAVQAGVGAHILDDRPEEARAVLEAISTTSRSTLGEMRRMLGVLRDEDGERANAPAPGLADLHRLVADVRGAGVPATLHVEGPLGGVPAGVELSAYRVVQEALTNVIKHAGTPTRVAVDIEVLPAAVTVEVVDDGRGLAARQAPPGDGSGHGLVGMRERVEVWGGELTVGPAPGGGYRVAARLPYGDAG